MAISFDDIVRRLAVDENAFSAYAEVFSGIPPERSFLEVFHIDLAELNEFGATLSEWMALSGEIRSYFSKLHWLSRGLIQFQDLLSLADLEATAHAKDLVEVFSRHHCYYEALAHLRSGTVCLLNANASASITMLRPIVEQFVYSIYWDISQEGGDTGRYNVWLRTKKGKPSFKDTLEYIDSNLKMRRNLIAKRINNTVSAIRQGYHVLCTWSHTPAPDEALTTGGFTATKGSLGALLYCLHMYNIILHSILRLYAFQYPMSLFPVDVIRKWGCNMPIGIYIDDCSGSIIKEALGDATTAKLRQTLFEDQEVIDKLAHAANFPGLSDDEIWLSWEKSTSKADGLARPEDIASLAAQQKAQLRSLGWAWNYIPRTRLKEELTADERAFFKRLYGIDYQTQEP